VPVVRLREVGAGVGHGHEDHPVDPGPPLGAGQEQLGQGAIDQATAAVGHDVQVRRHRPGIGLKGIEELPGVLLRAETQGRVVESNDRVVALAGVAQQGLAFGGRCQAAVAAQGAAEGPVDEQQDARRPAGGQSQGVEGVEPRPAVGIAGAHVHQALADVALEIRHQLPGPPGHGELEHVGPDLAHDEVADESPPLELVAARRRPPEIHAEADLAPGAAATAPLRRLGHRVRQVPGVHAILLHEHHRPLVRAQIQREVHPARHRPGATHLGRDLGGGVQLQGIDRDQTLGLQGLHQRRGRRCGGWQRTGTILATSPPCGRGRSGGDLVDDDSVRKIDPQAAGTYDLGHGKHSLGAVKQEAGMSCSQSIENSGTDRSRVEVRARAHLVFGSGPRPGASGISCGASAQASTWATSGTATGPTPTTAASPT